MSWSLCLVTDVTIALIQLCYINIKRTIKHLYKLIDYLFHISIHPTVLSDPYIDTMYIPYIAHCDVIRIALCKFCNLLNNFADNDITIESDDKEWS